MSASKVRMGQAFVEIGADASKLFKALNQANARIGKFATSLRNVGGRMMAAGTAMAAPIAAAAVQGARFQDVLLNMRASTGATAQEMGQVRSAAMAMSQALGVGPTEAASGFLELMKAGMSLEQVLSGAGQAAVQFAKVGQMDVSQAAVVMADAMAVFGVGGERAANTLSAAADASSTDIQGIALAFSQVSAVAGLANQSIGDTAAALAILANSGVKGSDAGTSLKTMLMRLMAPAEDAAQALADIGLSVDSFRTADGRVRSMAEIIGTLNTAMAGMGGGARDDIFRRIFGSDAIRAAAILTTAGTEGFGAMVRSMDEALPVGAKFNQVMSGMSGTTTKVMASLQRLAIAVTDAVGPALMQVGQQIADVVSGLATWASANGETVAAVAKGIVTFAAASVAVYGLGAALGAVSAVAGVVLPIFGSIVAATVAMGTGFVALIGKVVAFKMASVAAAAASAAVWAVTNLAIVGQIGFFALFAGAVFKIAGGFDLMRSAVSGVRDGIVTAAQSFTTLREIGVSTFEEIMASIKAGDVGGAMQVAMRGLMAAFTVGSSAFLAAVDEWGVNLVNAFDFYISQIPFLRFFGKDSYKFSVFGDSREGGNTPDARADARFAGLNQRNEARQAASSNAMAGLDRLLRGRATARTAAAPGLPTVALPAIPSPAPGSFEADIAALGGGQPGEFDAWMAEMQARQQRDAQMLAAQRQMQAQAASQAEVAGTFSAQAVGGLGFGGSLQQQMADYARRTAEATEQIAGESLLAVIDR